MPLFVSYNITPTNVTIFQHLGNGEKKEEYINFCKKNNLSNVLFLPAVPRKEARNLISQIDICIQPLPNNEHFFSTLTSKTFDYLALGKPIIFCGSGDTAELLQKSGGGVVVPPEDDKPLAEAILMLAENKNLRQKMSNFVVELHKPRQVTNLS